MNTGRNWTRRSIEELIDDFLKRQKAPTPPPTSTPQYIKIAGKIASTNQGGAYLHIRVANSPNPFMSGSGIDGACVEIPYSITTGVNMEYNARNTYFPFGFTTFEDLPYVYFMPIDYYPSGFVGTCYKLTRTSPIADLPRIGSADKNTTFRATVSPTSIHSIPTTQTQTMSPTAFCFGMRDDAHLVAMQDLDTAVRNNIMTPLGKTLAIALLSTFEISNAEIQAAFSGITNFQSLTY